ncbi:ATP-binding protein [Dyella choica]|uniref:ATP-binding protein n=1 Tax=Dyella choica TaxID=1927959 RepID=A0A3S0PRL7_9GAMM|nr:ATP-binding protein [Dyella choica]RUL79929.1 ATP-binding protein [Dyella choica]
MSFQAMVGTWLATQLIADMRPGTRFGLTSDLQPIELQFETGDALDDVVLRLTNDAAIYVQCKTRPSLESGPDSALGKTIAQLVTFAIAQQAKAAALDPSLTAAVLAVADNAPRSIDALEEACRQFDHGEAWASVLGRVSDAQKTALGCFKLHAGRAWNHNTGMAITDDQLVELAKLFRIRRFGADATSTDWREMTRVIGSRLYGGAEFGEQPTLALLNFVRQMIRSGASANRFGLARALRSSGYPETHAPGFDTDVAVLRRYATEECERLARHTILDADSPAPVDRDCLPALRTAIDGGSLLVIGEPGAGKTGVLVALAKQSLNQSRPLIFLSVDRLAGVSTLSALKGELGLQHDLIEVLTAWPGEEPGILIVDALDASRGGPSEAVFALLIELAQRKVGDRWSIVASIRTFDLINGRRFRDVMRGDSPDPSYADLRLRGVRHFSVKALSPGELGQIGKNAPKLGELIATSPPTLHGLLQNIFNLSLAADLIKAGVASSTIRNVTTQSELIDRYEDERLRTQPLKRAASAAIGAMVASRRLSIPQVEVDHDALDDVLQAGVMVKAGDLVAFAHHVLFDHVASRFYLSWNDIDRLKAQVSDDSGAGLLLGPALRFTMERIWQNDDVNRWQSWKLATKIASSTDVDPIMASVALRTIAERVESQEDVQGLVAYLTSATDRPIAGSTLSKLARFVGMAVAQGLSPPVGIAWAAVARAASELGDRCFVDGARFLLWSLFERADFKDANFTAVFGAASRSLLRTALSMSPYVSSITATAIRCVARSYSSDADASRTLLSKIFEEPHFSEHAHTEVPWLAESVRNLIEYDAPFAATIYRTLYARPAPKAGKTWLGGQLSRILPLSIDMKQEYEHAYWHLSQAIPFFLDVAPADAIAAVIGAVNGAATSGRRAARVEIQAIEVDGRFINILDEFESLQDWRQDSRATSNTEYNVLNAFTQFLVAADSVKFKLAVNIALATETASSVWARLLRIASEKLGAADDLLWPIASTPAFVSVGGFARDAIIYLQRVYPTRSARERVAFEASALSPQLLNDTRAGNWWRGLLARWLSVLPEDALATDEMKLYRATLASKNRLQGNPPFISIEAKFGGDVEIGDVLLTRGGVDLQNEPDRSLRFVSKALEDAVKPGRSESEQVDIPGLWRKISQVINAIDEYLDPAPHAEILHSSWGAVSNALEQIVNSEAYAPESDGHPGLPQLLALNVRLRQSPYPEPRQQGDESALNDDESALMAWGNWDVRVYAASTAIGLARRFTGTHPAILDELDLFVRDRVRTVRLQVAQSVNALWDVSRERMWGLADYIAKNEPSLGVLAFFVGGPLQRIASAEPVRTGQLLSEILDRFPVIPGSTRSTPHDFYEAVGNLIGWLCVSLDSAQAWARFNMWCADVVGYDSFLWSMLSSLRGAFFLGYKASDKSEFVAVRERAKCALERILAAAADAKQRAEPILRSSDAPDLEKSSAEALYIAGERLIGHACDELYFGSGAFRESAKEGPGVTSHSEMRSFLVDYRTELDVIGQHGAAQTIHHLIELYAFLVDASPGDVFDRVASILTGPALSENYQSEGLGAQVLVSLIRVYLADHREIFEDPSRRAQLIAVLESFSSEGWPDALKLLYELPDLLR